MPNIELDNMIAIIEATKNAIFFLQKNKENMVNLAINTIRKSKEYSILEQNNDLEIFKDSIINGHIEWIIEDLYNPEKVSFNKFNIHSIKNMPKAYYSIYIYLSEYIENTSIPTNSKEILKDYFLAFSKIFK